MRPVVIVSRPSVLSASQEHMCACWELAIAAIGFRVSGLHRCQYETDPWGQLQHLMERADGLLALGCRQLLVKSGVWRLGTPEEDVPASDWTSPWLQIEAGMAIMAGVPVLVVPERSVTEGVFAPDTWVDLVFGVSTGTEPSRGIPDEWATAVVKRFKDRSNLTDSAVS